MPFYRKVFYIFYVKSYATSFGILLWEMPLTITFVYIVIPANVAETSKVTRANPLCANVDILLSLVAESGTLLPLYVTPHS